MLPSGLPSVYSFKIESQLKERGKGCDETLLLSRNVDLILNEKTKEHQRSIKGNAHKIFIISSSAQLSVYEL